MKFKVVSIYSGYNEMSINSVFEVNWRNNNIKSLVRILFKSLKFKFCEYGHINFWNEFSDKGVINEELGFYGCAEEGFNLVIREDNNWYNRLSNYENWTDIENEEWREFCGSIA